MRILPIFFAALILASSVGCSGTPSQRYEKSVRTYSAVGELAVIAIDRDFVSLDVAESIGAIDNAAYAELVLMRGALADEPVFETHYARFRRIIASLIELTKDPGTEMPATPQTPQPNFGGGQ